MLLSDILTAFDSQLSQEQTWAVCYMSTKSLSARRRENLLNRKKVNYVISIDGIKIHPTGQISIVVEEDAAQRQKEVEVIKNLGTVLCRCLDHGLDVSLINDVNFEPDMAELIAGMVLQQFDEDDEGIDDENIDSFPSKGNTTSLRCFRSFDEISRFCEARLLRKNIDTGGEHYRNVLKALYVESHELKLFLDQVTPSLELASADESHKLNPGVASTAQECVYQWARFWLQVMHELRRGVHLRNVTQTKVSPLEYEFTPFEIAKEEAVTSGAIPKPSKKSGLPENAGKIILDFILSRPSDLGKLEEEDDNEISELEIGESSPELPKSENNNHRKPLRVQKPLLAKIENWNVSQESLLSDEDLNQIEVGQDNWRGGKVAAKNSLRQQDITLSRQNSVDSSGLDDQRKRLVRRRSAELTSQEIVDAIEADLQQTSTLASTKKRLAVSVTCLTDISLDDDPRAVGTSLFEMSKTRQAIVEAEVECLTVKGALHRDVRYGKVCFACHKTRFSIFKDAKQCEICRKKFCKQCTVMNFEVPDHLIKTETEFQKPSHSMPQGLSKSLGNLNTLSANDTITPFPCKRQSIFQVGAKKNYGRKLVNLCKECKMFMDSIVIETKNTRWHVGMTMDI